MIDTIRFEEIVREAGRMAYNQWPGAGHEVEMCADRLKRDLIWLVDPIDGTRDFIHGRKGWAVSVALISAGKPLIGMLAAPAQGEEWLSLAGQGATRNGEVLKASNRLHCALPKSPPMKLI